LPPPIPQRCVLIDANADTATVVPAGPPCATVFKVDVASVANLAWRPQG
jgi:hypothetical protein